MNHDYAHCLDFQKDCPKECFRAQLAMDLAVNGNIEGVWLSWMHLNGTEECLKKAVTAMKPRNLNSLIRIEDAIRVLCQKTCTPGVACPDSYCKEMWEAFEDIERVDAIPVALLEDQVKQIMAEDAPMGNLLAMTLNVMLRWWKERDSNE